jgi:MFS family permease
VTARSASLLATRYGKLLLLLCAVQFLDVVDSSIMNLALPSIRRDLGFSAQGLQWVLSGYLVTYGGCCCSAAAPATCSDGGGCSWRAPRYSRPARWPAAWRWTRACWSAPGSVRAQARR